MIALPSLRALIKANNPALAFRFFPASWQSSEFFLQVKSHDFDWTVVQIDSDEYSMEYQRMEISDWFIHIRAKKINIQSLNIVLPDSLKP